VKVHGVIGAESQVLCRLLAAVRQACEGSGERLIVCELPDDLPFHRAAEALGISGYREEGRVPDFVRDGVALRLVVWRA
jgi:hypothetical protein